MHLPECFLQTSGESEEEQKYAFIRSQDFGAENAEASFRKLPAAYSHISITLHQERVCWAVVGGRGREVQIRFSPAVHLVSGDRAPSDWWGPRKGEAFFRPVETETSAYFDLRECHCAGMARAMPSSISFPIDRIIRR
jgi:hypothetical protein